MKMNASPFDPCPKIIVELVDGQSLKNIQIILI